MPTSASGNSEFARIAITLEGLAPLICANHISVSQDPPTQFRESVFWIDRDANRFGFPADGIFSCLCAAAEKNIGGLINIQSGRLIEVSGDLAPRSDWDSSRRAHVHRAEVYPWTIARIATLFRHAHISAEDILDLYDRAGFGVGIGDRRPGKNGMFGTFYVSSYQLNGITKKRSSPSDPFEICSGGTDCPEESTTPTAA